MGLDRTLAEIGAVAKTVDSVFFRFGFCQAIVDLIEQFDAAFKRPFCLGNWAHFCLVTRNTTWSAHNQKVNSFLTQVQRYKGIRVNGEGTQKRGICACGGEFCESGGRKIIQAIDRDAIGSNCSSGERRLCDAFSNWRTRTAGTGRLNR